MPLRRRRLAALLFAIPAALFGPANAGAADDEVVVFAAASLTDVPQAIARQGGFTQVKFSFAA